MQIFASMPVLADRAVGVEDIRHCVTQVHVSDVIGVCGKDVSESMKSLPPLVSLSLANTLPGISVEEVEKLASNLPKLRNLNISRFKLSQNLKLLLDILSRFHCLKLLHCTQVLDTDEQQTANHLAVRHDCRIVTVPQ